MGVQYNGQTVTILHSLNGTLQTYIVHVAADGKATFSVSSLSPFAVFAASSGVKVPQTGDESMLPLALTLLSAGALGMLTVLCRRRGRI